jgi:hypothetical protein
VNDSFNGGPAFASFDDQHLQLPPATTAAAPEIDPTSALSGMTLILGVLAALRAGAHQAQLDSPLVTLYRLTTGRTVGGTEITADHNRLECVEPLKLMTDSSASGRACNGVPMGYVKSAGHDQLSSWPWLVKLSLVHN